MDRRGPQSSSTCLENYSYVYQVALVNAMYRTEQSIPIVHSDFCRNVSVTVVLDIAQVFCRHSHTTTGEQDVSTNMLSALPETSASHRELRTAESRRTVARRDPFIQ